MFFAFAANANNPQIPAQIQIPASTIHLVMNIPKLVVPCGSVDSGLTVSPTLFKNPITYRIDKN